MTKHRVRRCVAACSVLAIGATGTVAAASTPQAAKKATSHATKAPWGWPGNAKIGYLPPNEPKVHKGYAVRVGLITAGDINDHGYYQSEVTTLQQFAKRYHWGTIIQGNVNPANALQAAQNLCAQHVDLVLIGESELAAAGPAASTSVCKETPFWAYASAGTMPASPYYYLATDLPDPQSYVTGVAMGLWMKQHNTKLAGFVTGPALSFTERPARGYFAGIRSVVPGARLITTYTGDFNASGPAITAVQSMITKGVRMIFPFLGGSLFPTAQYATKHGVAVVSDGGNYCNANGVSFAIRQVYDPGYYLPYALAQFAKGTMRVGVTKTFNFGLTPVPTVQFCKTGKIQSNATLNRLMAAVGKGKLNTTKLINNTPQPS